MNADCDSDDEERLDLDNHLGMEEPDEEAYQCESGEDNILDECFAPPVKAVRNPNDTRSDGQIVLALMASGQKEKAKNKMCLAIRKVVRTQLFGFKKLIDDNSDRDVAAEWVLSQLNFKDFDDEATAAWLETHGPFVTKVVNESRGCAQTGVKKVVHEWWDVHAKTMIDKKWLPLILTRQLDMKKLDDYEVFRWWVTEALPKCCGYAGGWDDKKYKFMEVWNACNPNKPQDVAVTASTEAIGAWHIENNCTAWPAQWAVKAEHPTLKLEKHCNDANGNPISVANSKVSH